MIDARFATRCRRLAYGACGALLGLFWLVSHDASGSAGHGRVTSDYYHELVAPALPTLTGDALTRDLGGRRFAIPAVYLHRPLVNDGWREDVALRVVLPDLAPFTPATAAVLGGSRGWGQRLLIEVGAAPAEAERRAGTAAPRHLGVARARDHDLEQPDATVRCNGPERVALPGCEHVFVYDGLRVRLLYGVEHAGERAAIQRAVTRLLASFRAA